MCKYISLFYLKKLKTKLYFNFQIECLKGNTQNK